MVKSKTRFQKRCYLFPKTLQEASHTAISHTFEKRGFFRQDFLTHWPEIVGKEIAAVCTPVKLVFPSKTKETGVMHVVAVAGRTLEVQHLERYIIHCTNTFMGKQVVEKLKIFQSHPMQ